MVPSIVPLSTFHFIGPCKTHPNRQSHKDMCANTPLTYELFFQNSSINELAQSVNSPWLNQTHIFDPFLFSKIFSLPLHICRPFWYLQKTLLFFILFIFICHTIITKNIGKGEKKEVARRPNRNYRRLGLLELWARAVSHQLKKRWRKVEEGKICELFSYDLVVKWIKNPRTLKKGQELLRACMTIQ